MPKPTTTPAAPPAPKRRPTPSAASPPSSTRPSKRWRAIPTAACRRSHAAPGWSERPSTSTFRHGRLSSTRSWSTRSHESRPCRNGRRWSLDHPGAACDLRHAAVGMLASASRAASRMAATLRSASARRRSGRRCGRVVSASASSVARHRVEAQSQLRHEVSCPRQDGQSDQAGGGSEEPGCDERVRDPGCRRAGDGAAPGRDRKEIAIPSLQPISWPVELRPEIIPVLLIAGTVRMAIETETIATPSPSPATSIPGRTSRT